MTFPQRKTHPTATPMLRCSMAASTPRDTCLPRSLLGLLHFPAVARVTTSTTIVPTASENGGHIMEK